MAGGSLQVTFRKGPAFAGYRIASMQPSIASRSLQAADGFKGNRLSVAPDGARF
jgi:hypothetical protein